MPATHAQLEAVLIAAADVLGGRQDRMLGLEEWAALARAVAACNGVKTADLLTERDLDDIADLISFDWNENIDGPLPPLDDE